MPDRGEYIMHIGMRTGPSSCRDASGITAGDSTRERRTDTMALARWDPMREVGSTREQMNRLFQQFFGQPGGEADV
jgi:hypothetical protein